MAVIQDKTITLPITFSKTDENQPVEDFVFIRCEFIGGSDFSTNLERKNIVIYESRSRLGKIIFRGQGMHQFDLLNQMISMELRLSFLGSLAQQALALLGLRPIGYCRY